MLSHVIQTAQPSQSQLLFMQKTVFLESPQVLDPSRLTSNIDAGLDNLVEQFNASRLYSTRLVESLSPEDCQAQSMADASPAKWHLAHVTWFYEVMILKPYESNFQFWNPQFAVL